MRPGPSEPENTGRLAYLQPGEQRHPGDERRVINPRSFWSSPEESAAYLTAVREHPRQVDLEAQTIESSMSYIGRIAGIVAELKLAPPVKAFPKRWEEPARPHTFEVGYEERLDKLYERSPGEEG